jgi:hypothetical protein
MKVDNAKFKANNLTHFFPGAAEAIPPNILIPNGKSVVVTYFCDDYGILIYIKGSLVSWYPKRQNTVESSTFGSEFIAMSLSFKQVEALRYKLNMMGIPVDGPASVYCDNESVFKNCSAPESTLTTP